MIKSGAVMRPWQAEEAKDELSDMKTMLQEHGKVIQDKGAFVARIKNVERQLDRYAPEPLAGKEKDVVAEEIKDLEAYIPQGMQTMDERMKCPVDAPYYLRRWENATNARWGTRKNAILRYKALKYQLYHDEVDNRDMGNIERLAPTMGPQGYRSDAVMPGAMGYLNVPQKNWDHAFDPTKKVPSALDQVKEHDKKARAKRILNEEQKQALRDRLAIARQRKVTQRQKVVTA